MPFMLLLLLALVCLQTKWPEPPLDLTFSESAVAMSACIGLVWLLASYCTSRYCRLLTENPYQRRQILTQFSLEMSGNYLDFIRADSNYRFMSSWHYVSIPDGKRYADIPQIRKET